MFNREKTRYRTESQFIRNKVVGGALLAGLNATDWAITKYAITNHLAHESNPIASTVLTHGGFEAVAIGKTLLIGATLLLVAACSYAELANGDYRKRRNISGNTLAAMNIFFALIVLNNLR